MLKMLNKKTAQQETIRADEIVIVVVARKYDPSGAPIAEANSIPMKLFRSTVPDVWAYIDSMQDKLSEFPDPAAKQG